MFGLGLGFGLGSRGAGGGGGVPGLARPDFSTIGETALFLYHPHTESVTLSGAEVTAVTGTSSPNMARGTTGPLEVTDGLGRKFWRFRGSDFLEIAPADITFTPRAITIIMVGRQHKNQNAVNFFGQSYQSDGVTLCAFFSAMFQSYGVSGEPSYLRAGGVNARGTATGATHMAVGSQLQVFGIGGRTTANGGSRFVMNDNAVNHTQPTVTYTDMKGARLGGYARSNGTGNTFDCYAIVGVAGELSDARVDAIAALLVSAYNVPAVTSQIILEGDSITTGVSLGSHENPAMMLTEPGAEMVPTSTRVINLATSGSTVASLVTRRDLTGGWPGTALPGGSANNILAFQIGRNDHASGGATITANITAYLNTASTGVLARGFNTSVAINIGCSNSVVQANLEGLRTLLRDASFLTGVDAGPGGANEGRVSRIELPLITLASDTLFDTAADLADAAISYDGTHLTATGLAYMTNGADTPENGLGAIL
jgi:hypothetical protein